MTTLRVTVENPPGTVQTYVFHRTFQIGRAADCDIRIDNKYVSRNHVEVAYELGQWHVRDLSSSNGVFVSGQPARTLPVANTAAIRLGVRGPFVSFSLETAPNALPSPQDVAPAANLVQRELIGWNESTRLTPQSQTSETANAVPTRSVEHRAGKLPPNPRDSLADYIDHYFDKGKKGQTAGPHTTLVRMAFSEVQKRHQFKWLTVVGMLVLLVAVISTYALYERKRGNNQRLLAESIFYSMKSLDVDIANFERAFNETNDGGIRGELLKFQARRTQMQGQYDKFLTSIRVNDLKLSPQQRITLRIARVFGECELAMPPGFQAEIDRYIQQWRTSNRLSMALATAREKGYIRTIRNELLAVDLPPQFFYLALQESNFDPYASGPETRKGIAKGMWQFIPETASRYGLRVGPLIDLRQPDPADDRHHWELETRAAARYLKDLYSSDAQASGLLVMACYNWGENQVLPLVRALPPNPGDRNFWKLLAKYRGKLPDETYGYVLSIMSAAVIGEDPRLFGFDFDNPLAGP
jgi:membrane-bound lytic murein transglycosylase D